MTDNELNRLRARVDRLYPIACTALVVALGTAAGLVGLMLYVVA